MQKSVLEGAGAALTGTTIPLPQEAEIPKRVRLVSGVTEKVRCGKQSSRKTGCTRACRLSLTGAHLSLGPPEVTSFST